MQDQGSVVYGVAPQYHGSQDGALHLVSKKKKKSIKPLSCNPAGTLSLSVMMVIPTQRSVIYFRHSTGNTKFYYL
jgi:hypothetical protein